MVAGAVILPTEIDYLVTPWVSEITDSKQLNAETRERLAPLITGWAFRSAIGVASVEEVDQLNIYHASHLAMKRAIEKLSSAVEHILVDGKFSPRGLSCPSTAIVKGDSLCLSIAAGSIIAKVWRDQRMRELDLQYPGYGFGVHKGYATRMHSDALKKHGVCPIHRRSFAPVAALAQESLFKT